MMTRLVFLPRSADSAPYALDVSADGRILSYGALEAMPATDARVVVAAPGAQALARWIDLPARTEAQARSAAGFLLEDALAAPRDATHVALGPVAASGRRLAVAVDKAAMRDWLAEIANLGLVPSALVPDHLLLPPPEPGQAIAAEVDGMIALRGDELAVTCEPELVPLIAGPRALVRLEGKEVGATLARGALDPPLNLLQGEFAPRSARRLGPSSLRAPALLLAALLALPLLSEGVRLVRHAAAAETMRSQAEAAARAALPPEQAQARDPVAIAKARAAVLAGGGAGGFPAMAAALFAGVERTQGLSVERMLYTPDGLMRVSVAYSDYSAVETLRAGLSSAGFQVEEGGSTTSPVGVVTELTIGAAP